MLKAILCIALCIAAFASNLNPLRHADLHFSAEDDSVKNAVPIPGDIWSLLKQDADVSDAAQNQTPPTKSPPRAWFSAARVHLHGSSANDLVVMGRGPIRGANMTTFWVFADTLRGRKLVLKLPAHDLVIRDAESDGYKIIDASAVIGAAHVSTLTYKFDGNHYILSRKIVE
jgi:hypothetical protein